MQGDFDILIKLAPITLGEMDSIHLMNRIDTKYLTDTPTLYKILQEVSEIGYRILENAEQREQQYRSMYYDTTSLQMYLDHHNRRLVRQKLRTRCYVSSGETFLELKNKNNHGRTKKKRIEIQPDNYGTMSLTDPCILEWLDGRISYPASTLTPSLETIFTRITLVNPEMTERSTIDFNLRFNNVRKDTVADIGELVIIEVKQDGNLPSKLREILRENRVKPIRISKYCIGTALTDNTVKANRFKNKILLINKIKNLI